MPSVRSHCWAIDLDSVNDADVDVDVDSDVDSDVGELAIAGLMKPLKVIDSKVTDSKAEMAVMAFNLLPSV
ncbi:hypothetical protein Q4557_08185 [Shewanella sp. 5_MG-2023]|uniref:hypothetical protein n=1 Tax=Shewanella sp. 5_MG-2023 TaxID=3062656 RepID=UPI0026E1BA84|nr:hypothetical protein [Shewanella sp. 5_MG-2023]MDO6639936.1 hypothetical protein [Shewanella sp. 5_MG-2023]